MRACTAWPGTWELVWCKGVEDMTAVAITAIICITIIILAWMSNHTKK